jgi:hypothetical protein
VKAFVAALVLAVNLGGCAGYRVGDVKPQYLSAVHSIAVPTFENKTYLPRLEVLMTDTVIKQLQQDGTFRITNEDKSDAVLKGEIRSVVRNPARSLRGNVLATTEFNVSLIVRYTLTGRDGKVLTGPVDVVGTTSFFVDQDIATDQRQALPLAAEALAVNLTSQLAEGW